jgi:IS30 family transposase
MVEDKLELRWSPEQIAGWLRRRFPTGTVMHVSHETIYRAVAPGPIPRDPSGACNTRSHWARSSGD